MATDSGDNIERNGVGPEASNAISPVLTGKNELDVIREINKLGASTADGFHIDSDSKPPQEVKVDNGATVSLQDGHPIEIKYKNGTSRQFAWANNELVGMTDTSGKRVDRDERGNWNYADSCASGIGNLYADQQGRLSFTDGSGKLMVIGTDGKQHEIKLAKDLHAYPDGFHREQELARIHKELEGKHITNSASTMITDMHKLGIDDVDIWHGSYVSVKGDGGELFRKWSQLPGAEKRGSSHEHVGKQYQIKLGVGDGVVLFGTGRDGNTFFQIEHHASRVVDGPEDLPGEGQRRVVENLGRWAHGNFTFNDNHGDDKDLFDKIHQNIGRLGISPYVDRNPLEIQWRS